MRELILLKHPRVLATNGATTADVLLMKEVVKGQLKIKASGGISDKETALNYISMGVSRIGTSSGIKIVT